MGIFRRDKTKFAILVQKTPELQALVRAIRDRCYTVNNPDTQDRISIYAWDQHVKDCFTPMDLYEFTRTLPEGTIPSPVPGPALHPTFFVPDVQRSKLPTPDFAKDGIDIQDAILQEIRNAEQAILEVFRWGGGNDNVLASRAYRHAKATYYLIIISFLFPDAKIFSMDHSILEPHARRIFIYANFSPKDYFPFKRWEQNWGWPRWSQEWLDESAKWRAAQSKKAASPPLAGQRQATSADITAAGLRRKP